MHCKRQLHVNIQQKHGDVHDMETFQHIYILALCKGNHQSLADSLHKGPVILSFDLSIDASRKMPSKIKLSCHGAHVMSLYWVIINPTVRGLKQKQQRFKSTIKSLI